jgi:hypothetical protein
MLREPAVLEKIGLGKTKFKEHYIDTGRLSWVYTGRVKRLPEHELDRVIAEDIAARDANPQPPKPAFSRDAYMKGAHSKRHRSKRTAAAQATA